MNMQNEIPAADHDQIENFVGALFRYASEGTVVSLRAFDDLDRNARPFAIEAVTLSGAWTIDLPDAATRLATRCAQAERPIVFCPPVTTFRTADNAKQENVAEGLALSVECDAAPSAARETLAAILGPPTLVIASGGEWTDPETGEVQDKLHLHWRLTEPTTTPEDHATLKEARRLATALVGSDATNVPLVHPIRWPGSWHRKGTPKMAQIVAANGCAEIELQEALEALQEAVGASAQGNQQARPEAPATGAQIDTGEGFARKTAEDYADLLAACARDGWKHHAVVRLAASLAAQGCSQRFVEGVIRHHCPVWDRGVEKAIASGFDKYRKQTAEPAPTGDPVDLWGTFPPPDLPEGLLPPVIETFARANGAQMGADPAGLAVAALVCCATAIRDEIKLRVKRHDEWHESARLWAALIGPPSAKKSPILSRATGPICRLDADLMRQWLARVSAWNQLSADEKKGTPKPPQTRLRIEDATIEAAQDVLSGSPWGVLLLQDELSGWFAAMDKYNGGKGAQADRAFWLRSFNGGQFAFNRVGRGAGVIDNLSVSMLGGIQPEPLRAVAGDSVDDGLLQRLFPITLRKATMGRDDPMPPINEEYRALIENLRDLRAPGFHGMGALQFDDGAQAIRRDLEAKHLDLQSTETVNKKLASHLGKYDGLFARLCVVWHCVEHAGADLPHTVTEATAKRVAAFLHDFLLKHAVAFYAGALGLSDDHDRLSAIAGYILARRLDRVTNRDVQRGDKTMRGLRENEIRPLLEQLASLGWLEQTAGPRPSSAPQWVVNPAVHQRFADRADAERTRREEARAALNGLLGLEA